VCVSAGVLQAIKFLQQAVGLRGYASKDPLTEFKLEGYNLFLETMAQIRRNVIYNVYVFQPQRIRPDAAAGQQQQQAAEQQAASSNGKQSRRKAKASA
jgi:preprotein translocase subunit SecA